MKLPHVLKSNMPFAITSDERIILQFNPYSIINYFLVSSTPVVNKNLTYYDASSDGKKIVYKHYKPI